MIYKKNIIVTGGAGFLGVHLCERLLHEANVICIDNFVTSKESNINHLLKSQNFAFINHDSSKAIDLETVKDLEKFQIDIFGISEIYNLACPMSVKNFAKYKIESVLSNTDGLINALNLAVKYKSKFMQFSTSVVYGDVPKGEFVREDYRGLLDMMDPRACYDVGKFYAESVVENYREKYSLDTKIIRIFRTYGPYMLIDDGQMICDFVIDALNNKNLTIYGGEEFITSLCYVSDIIDGCVKLMATDFHEPMNIGSTFVYKMADVAQKIIELTNSNSRVTFEKEQLFMRQLAFPDVTLIKEKIGWFPIVTLDDGLQKTVDFIRAHKDLLNFSTSI